MRWTLTRLPRAIYIGCHRGAHPTSLHCIPVLVSLLPSGFMIHTSAKALGFDCFIPLISYSKAIFVPSLDQFVSPASSGASKWVSQLLLAAVRVHFEDIELVSTLAIGTKCNAGTIG
jgi:hypothetical protein